MRNRIYVTNQDIERLSRLVEGLRGSGSLDAEHLAQLQEELDRAEVVDAADIPPDAVTMNSEVKLRDLDTGKVMTYKVVYPNSAVRGAANPVSVLAPLGTALLGYRAGSTITWRVPKGVRRLKVLQVLQPEAASKTAA